jgi:hypothetical protein
MIYSLLLSLLATVTALPTDATVTALPTASGFAQFGEVMTNMDEVKTFYEKNH